MNLRPAYGLRSKFQANQNYRVRLCLKPKQKSTHQQTKSNREKLESGNIAQLVDCLTSVHQALVQFPLSYKPDVVAYACFLRAQEVKAGGSNV